MIIPFKNGSLGELQSWHYTRWETALWFLLFLPQCISSLQSKSLYALPSLPCNSSLAFSHISEGFQVVTWRFLYVGLFIPKVTRIWEAYSDPDYFPLQGHTPDTVVILEATEVFPMHVALQL